LIQKPGKAREGPKKDKGALEVTLIYRWRQEIYGGGGLMHLLKPQWIPY